MASNNNELTFYQQGAAAGQQLDKYSAQPGCVDSMNLDIFSDSQSVKAMAWTAEEQISDDWVDVDPKGRFYLAADGKVWDSEEEERYDHDYFDANANQIDYRDGEGYSQADFGTPIKLFVSYSGDEWKTITVITDRLIYNIYSDWVRIVSGAVYGILQGETCLDKTTGEPLTGVTSVLTDQTSTQTDLNEIRYTNTGGQVVQAPGGFHSEPDRNEICMRMKVVYRAIGADFDDVSLSAYSAKLRWDNVTKTFKQYTYDTQVLNESGLFIEANNSIEVELYYDNLNDDDDYWNSYGGIRFHGTGKTTTCWVQASYYKKEDWKYLYPKDRDIMVINDEYYIEGLDSTQYDQLYYDPLEDQDGNVYYQLLEGNTLDFPDGYEIVAFARAFDYQYVFVNKGDIGIVYYATDTNLAAWNAGWRFPGVTFVNALMIGQYAYVIAEERGVRGLYIFYNGDLKKLAGADYRYTEKLNLVDGKEIYNFSGSMADWRSMVVCGTKDSVFVWGRNRFGSNAGAFILKVDGEISEISTERGYLDVYYTRSTNKYRKTLQDDVNIRRYETDFSITYPVQINAHIIEKEPMKLAVSYDIPNSSTYLDAYINVNDYHFWTFNATRNIELDPDKQYKANMLGGNYYLKFIEKDGNFNYTFELVGDIPYQFEYNSEILVPPFYDRSVDPAELITDVEHRFFIYSGDTWFFDYTDFNHFKKIGRIYNKSDFEKVGKHTLLNISAKNDLPIVRKAQVKLVGKTDNNVTPKIYDVRLLSTQFDK